MKIYPVKMVQTAPEIIINENPYAAGGGSSGPSYGSNGPSYGGSNGNYGGEGMTKFNIVPYGNVSST